MNKYKVQYFRQGSLSVAIIRTQKKTHKAKGRSKREALTNLYRKALAF